MRCPGRQEGGGEDKRRHTPGQTATKVIPSSRKASAYCTVSMLRAVLETLYAGVDWCWKYEDMVRDPMVEVLRAVSIGSPDIGVLYEVPGLLHVDDLLQIALSD